MLLLVVLVLTGGGCVRAGFVSPGEAAGDGTGEQSVDDADAARVDTRVDIRVDAFPLLPCATQPDQDTLLLYTFEGSSADQVIDATGSHPGSISGAGVTRTAGQQGCGKAIAFKESSPISYIAVPAAAVWDLPMGSVDFWIRLAPTTNVFEGIVARDAAGEGAGHLIFFRFEDRVVVRLQWIGDSAVRCSGPVTLDSWHHVGLNFGAGGLALDVDGAPADATGTIQLGTSVTLTCGSSTDRGIQGNNEPWVIGVAGWSSDPGSVTPVDCPLNGMIDSLRISKVRRSFSASN